MVSKDEGDLTGLYNCGRLSRSCAGLVLLQGAVIVRLGSRGGSVSIVLTESTSSTVNLFFHLFTAVTTFNQVFNQLVNMTMLPPY